MEKEKRNTGGEQDEKGVEVKGKRRWRRERMNAK
jgi:hypothetical protein